jgi:hypothetical protein
VCFFIAFSFAVVFIADPSPWVRLVSVFRYEQAVTAYNRKNGETLHGMDENAE